MNKVLIILLSILFLINITFADTNGIWIDAKDVVSGTFGSDEGNGNFSFPNNLGIGKTNPTSKLDVLGVTTTDGLIVEKNEGAIDIKGIDHTYIRFYPQASQGRKGWIGFGSSGTEKLSIQSENDILSLNPNGNNVGIGTLTATQKLDIAGNVRIRNNLYNDGAIYENGNRVATRNYVDNSNTNNFQLFTYSCSYPYNSCTGLTRSTNSGGWPRLTTNQKHHFCTYGGNHQELNQWLGSLKNFDSEGKSQFRLSLGAGIWGSYSGQRIRPSINCYDLY